MKLKSHIFQTLFKSLLLLAGFWALNTVKAHHVYGGEITYKHISGKKYLFTVSMFRNCDSDTFNSGSSAGITSLDILVSSNSISYSKRLDGINLKHVGTIEVPGFCSSIKTSCNSKSNPYPGVEKVIFEGTYDFTSLLANYCEFDIALKTDSRPFNYATIDQYSYYNYAYLNLCDGIANNSVVFKNEILHQINKSNSVYYNPLAFDADGDSLSYEFGSVLEAFKKSIPYPTGYAAYEPLQVYNSGNPWNYRVSPVEGIGIDAKTGFTAFTPTKTEHFFMVIQVNEWRKINGTYVKIGTVRRDNHWNVGDYANNSTKILCSFDSVKVCIGNSLNVDFNIYDANSTDTVKLKYYFKEKTGKLNAVINKSYAAYDAGFTCTIDNSFEAGKTYDLSVLTNDGICPWNSKSVATVRIKVYPKINTGFTYNYHNCNQLTVKSAKSNSSATTTFYLFKDNSLIDNSDGEEVTFTLNSGGNYKIRQLIVGTESNCQEETETNVFVPLFSKPKINSSKWLKNVCMGTEVTLKTDISNGTKPFKFYWNTFQGVDSISKTISSAETIDLSIIDSNGCEDKASVTIIPYPVLKYNLRDTAFCYLPALLPIELNKKISVISGTIKSTSWTATSTSGNLDLTLPAKPKFKPNNPFKNELNVSITDAFNCKYEGVLKINAIKLEPTNIVRAPHKLCINAEETDLNLLSSCSLSNGIWSIPVNASAIVNNHILIPQNLKADKYKIHYQKQMEPGCIAKDSLFLEILDIVIPKITQGKEIFTCNNSTSLQLLATPNGGEWITPNIFGKINPKEVFDNGQTNVQAIYKYTDPKTGCWAFDSSIVKINVLGSINKPSNEKICGGSSLTKTFEFENLQSVSASQSSGPKLITGNRLFENTYKFTSTNSSAEEQVCFTLTGEGLKGCPNLSQDFCIQVNPKPEIDLIITNAEGCAPLNSSVSLKNYGVIPDSVEWKDLAGTEFNINSKTYQFDLQGNYYVSVTASKAGCKSDPVQAKIKVHQPIISNFIVEPGTLLQSTDYPVFVFKDRTTFAGNYKLDWTFEKGNPATSNQKNVTVSFPRISGLYNVALTTTTDNGCYNTKKLAVRIEPGFTFFAPTAFTPDKIGPVKNEEFRVITDSCVEFELIIKNKWGETLFRTQDQKVGWNGNANGGLAPNGAYLYLVKGRTKFGRYFEEKGVFTLIR